MTDNCTPDPKPSAKQPAPKATLGGETVEPRILLSATWIDGSNLDETITGTLGNDIISAMGGNDLVLGLTGNDVLRGGTGNDVLDGGLGFDFVDYSTATGAVSVDLGAGTSSGADGKDTLLGIEGAIGSNYADTLRGSSGSDALKGGAGNDTLVGGAGNDGLDGGAGRDTVDYSSATSAVTVDLTRTTAQNTGGAGTDMLASVERAVGSAFNDTFAFTAPVDGAVYEIDGGPGTNTIDVSGYSSSAITFGDGSIKVDMGSGQSFCIDYDRVATIRFADVTAKVLTVDTNVSSFSGTGLYIDGAQAFCVGVGGAGSVNWTYDVDTDRFEVTGTQATNGGSSVSIVDHNGTDLDVGKITLDGDLGSFSSNADIDEIELNGSNTAVTTITVGGGSGTLGRLHTTSGNLDSAMTIRANVTDVDIVGQIRAAITIDGDVGTLDAAEIRSTGSLQISGNLGTLTTDDIEGAVTIGGDVGALVADEVTADIVIAGDLGSATFTEVETTAVITVNNAIGNVDFRVNDVQYGGTFATPTQLVFDGATGAATTSLISPIADAGIDQSVAEGALVQLNGAGSSDPNGDALTYAWVQTSGPSVTLLGANTATPTFLAPEGLVNSTVTFELKVSDGVNLSRVDAVAITINADDDAPVANAGVDQAVAEGDLVTLTGRASADPEGLGLTYAWVQTAGPAVTLSDANAVYPTFTVPEGLTNTIVQFELRTSDGVNLSSADTVRITINADDDAPSAEAGNDQTVAEGDFVRLDGRSSSDPEGQGLTYTWVQTGGPTVTLDDATSPQPTFTAPEGLVNTAITFRLQVSDGTQVVTAISSLAANLSIGNTSYDTVTIVVNADDDAPTVEAGATQQAEVGDAVLLHAEARDPEDRPLTYTWRQVSGPTVTMANASGANLVFQAPMVMANEAVVFEVSVTDGTNTTVDTVTVQVDPNSAPDVSVSAPGSVLAGDSAMVRATATDAEGDPLRYHWKQISGPSVMLSGTSNDRATFTAPTVVRPTEVQFQVAVTDGRSITTQTITVTILPDLTAAPRADSPVQPQLEPTTPTNGTPPTTGPTPGNSSSSTSTTSPGQSTEPSATTSGSGTPPTSQSVEPQPGPSWQPQVDAGSNQRVTEGSLVRLGARADFAQGAVHYTWTQVTGPTVLLAGAQSANPTFVAPDATSNYSVEFRVTASDGTTVVSDLVTVSVAADSGIPVLRDLATVFAEAGAKVEFATGIVDPAANLTATVKQTGGTPVVVGGLQGGNLSVRMPEVFAEEELTFVVEYVSNGERIVQEVRFSVQPVHSTGRADAVAETTEFEDHSAAQDGQDQVQRGVGKVWASLVAFTGMSQGRQKN